MCKIDSKIEMNFNGNISTYTLVGYVASLEESENVNIVDDRIGAITLLDSNFFKDDTIVNASILTNNIHKIYDTTSKLVENLKLDEIPNTTKITPINTNEVKNTSLLELIKSFREQVQDDKSDFDYDNINIPLETKNLEDNEKVIFNTSLLNYACVSEARSSFRNILLFVRHWICFDYQYL